ncbi:hypothetical protein NKR23_g3538 [Pleurostoma richardsiae]|uniref:Cyclin n=1 Tax=Pleurostoma richardsiae TaxID=41990 RepID=A0AA38VTS6_9PEZI|nr:hypothetical protein NKR23_g3538 [Pleurostoma richardsiae]
MHSLKLPSCLDPEDGDLSEFAAQITCLFWFEAPQTLRAAEAVHEQSSILPVPRLAAEAIPSPQFTKWVETVLRTTQVTQNVVLLALMFIYRLKMTNPTVRGRAGSEYRLLTVALMLGNKFLDDNTYTNKTWAEVSGISVQEIHVMEVEFLSNMRYSLLASKEEWEQWLVKLAGYWEYCKRAKEPMTKTHQSLPLELPSPTHRPGFTSPLASPTEHTQPAIYMQPTPPSVRSVLAANRLSHPSRTYCDHYQRRFPIGFVCQSQV